MRLPNVILSTWEKLFSEALQQASQTKASQSKELRKEEASVNNFSHLGRIASGTLISSFLTKNPQVDAFMCCLALRKKALPSVLEPDFV